MSTLFIEKVNLKKSPGGGDVYVCISATTGEGSAAKESVSNAERL